jgi:hypothetical protein
MMMVLMQKMMDELDDPETAFAFFNAVTRQHAGLASGVQMVRNYLHSLPQNFNILQKLNVCDLGSAKASYAEIIEYR